MAKAKSRKKAAKKNNNPMMGHNSDSAERDAELVKIAQAQRKLDKDKRDTRADLKERHDKLTGRLKEIGISRQAFDQPYANFCRLADAENDQDARKARDDNKVYLAQQRVAYNALGQGETIDWIDLIQDAAEIEKTREEAEREAAEAAAAGAEEPAETLAET